MHLTQLTKFKQDVEDVLEYDNIIQLHQSRPRISLSFQLTKQITCSVYVAL